MTSIREVAKLAGVSPATVSRVMNGTANVNEEKKKRVEAAIEETGFQPNELARALYKKSSKMIGMIVPDIENPFFSELAKAVEDTAYQNGYRILLCSSGGDEEKEAVNIQMFNQLRADGIVVMTNCAETGKVLADCPIPVVLVDRKLDGFKENALIEADNYKGGCLAAEHLVKCGCKNIVCMKEPTGYSSGRRRYEGYLDVCKKYNLKEQSVDCCYNYESGLRAAEEIIKKYPEVDGVVAGNDIVAMSVYKVFTRHGKKIPQEVQLVGFDDVGFGELFIPELTTIHQPIKEMGHLAAEIILKAVNGEPYEKKNVFDVKLIERETTKNNRKCSHESRER